MPPHYAPTSSEVQQAASAAVTAFKSAGISSCLVGGAACSLYGTTRVPGDVDLLVLTTAYEQEALKAVLVARDTRFYLVRAKTPGAQYQVLWFRLAPLRSCKVDVLVPGVMGIPAVPRASVRVHRASALPLMPLSGVLLLKLQAWADHRADHRAWMREKQFVDVADLRQLLEIARRKALRPASEGWLPTAFVRRSKERARNFVRVYPEFAEGWRRVEMLDGVAATPSYVDSYSQLLAQFDRSTRLR